MMLLHSMPAFTLFDKMHEGVLLAKEGKLVYFNPAFRKLFLSWKGKNQDLLLENLFHTNNTQLFDKDQNILPSDQWPFQKFRNHEKFTDEIYVVHNRHVNTTLHIIFSSESVSIENEDYDVLFVMKLEPDKMKEDKLQDLKNIHKIINVMPVMVSLYDREFNSFYLNKTIEKVTGWTNEDLKKRGIMELAYPDKNYRKKVEEYMSSLKPGFKDITMTTKDGRKIETSWTNVMVSKNRQMGIGLDIQKQKEAEKTLKDSEERFRNLADNISQLAWMAEPDGSKFWYNKRWYDYTGTTIKDVRGYGWCKVHHPDHVQRVLLYYKECMAEGKIWEDTFPIRSKKGEFRWYLSRALPIKDKNGKITRWFGTNTDITDIKSLQKELLEANERVKSAMQLQKTFIQNVSHEVRTPMNSILGFTEMLSRTIKTGEEKSHLDAISYNGKQLLNLIDDIIDFSRLDSKDLHLSNEIVSLKDVFYHVSRQFEALQSHYKKDDLILRINIKPGETDELLRTDPYRLQQVMSNLISNAVKYTDTGYVEIGYRIQRTDKQVLFFVKDTGIGIKEEQSSKIFKRFHQTTQEDTKYFKGTGLGLAISKHLVQLFGGDIWFESAEGKGSSFYFTHKYDENLQGRTIPLKKKTPENQILPQLIGKRILIAEDDDFSFKLMEAMLSDTGAEILHAATGPEAVELFNESEIDLVFLDIRLPGMSGYEVLQRIRLVDENIPVIAQSAYAMPEEKVKSREMGFNHHATKPISTDVLYSVLNKYLPVAKLDTEG